VRRQAHRSQHTPCGRFSRALCRGPSTYPRSPPCRGGGSALPRSESAGADAAERPRRPCKGGHALCVCVGGGGGGAGRHGLARRLIRARPANEGADAPAPRAPGAALCPPPQPSHTAAADRTARCAMRGAGCRGRTKALQDAQGGVVEVGDGQLAAGPDGDSGRVVELGKPPAAIHVAGPVCRARAHTHGHTSARADAGRGARLRGARGGRALPPAMVSPRHAPSSARNTSRTA